MMGGTLRWVCFCWCWLSCSVAMAAALPLTLPTGVAASGTNYVTSASQAFSGAAFNSALRAQVAGKLVTVPAAWRLASNAGRVAATAVRLNPAGLVTSAVAAWLMSYGLQWLDGQWVKKDLQADGWAWWSSVFGQSQLYGGAAAACQVGWDWREANNGDYYKPFVFSMQQVSDVEWACITRGSHGFIATDQAKRMNVCANGAPPVNGSCTGSLIPAKEEDWNAVYQGYLSDIAASELSAKSVALPVSPQVNPATQVVPLSDPYIDPVTGKRFQDVAYVTPKANDPTVADLQVAKQEVDAEGNPVTDPTTGGPVAPEKTDDPCLAHPTRLGCMEAGEPPEVGDPATQERRISITPDTGWGNDSAACPADLTTTFLGKPVAWSFKPVCDGADMFRPVVIGMAWFSAVLIALGISRRAG